MTMDIASSQNGPEILKMPSPKLSSDDHHTTIINHKNEIPMKNTIKRSFDVAFLMLPDEKIKPKNIFEKQPRIEEDIDVTTFNEDDEIESNETIRNYHRLIELENENLQRSNRFSIQNQKPRIYDDPTILPSPNNQNNNNNSTNHQDLEIPRSAFTKVPHSRLESPIPPSSPDQLSCHSNSPPISLSPPRTVYNNIRPEYFSGAFQPIQNFNPKMKQQFFYRPQLNTGNNQESAGYIPTATFPFNSNTHNPFVPQPDITGIVRNPAAAAILSTLIPPAIASTFTLTSQNVCAKCNINFRMTSDLVYHMRSHHKNDMGGDMARRKREEKLKCPVCNESFRERHHLTRHMTAHQDKDGDDTDNIIALSRRHHHKE